MPANQFEKWPPEYDQSYIPSPDSEYWNREIETMDPVERDKKVILPKLLGQLRWAYDNSEFYRKKWDKAKVNLRDIRSLADFEQIPFVTKDEIRQDQKEHPPFGSNLCVPRKDIARIHGTSGTTGKPKGIMHTTGGYLTGVHYSTKYVFDLKPEDVFWCTADIGWITGHSYITYGPLSNGATVVMYEGSPGYPDKDRFWHIIEKYGVSIFYTAPTAIRTFMRWGEKYPQRRNLSSLRLLGTVGEPINPEAWMWYYKNIGHERCPIVDTWWQTETGSIIVAPLPGVIPVKPGSATIPLPGYDVAVVDKDGHPVKRGEGGLLVIRKPWPSMLRGIYGDPDRYYETYWKKFGNLYFTGDGAKIDRDSYLWLLGRVDDVINVSGHRIGTMEVESACVDFPAVSEAAVIGIPHEIKGQAIVAFVTIKDGEAHSLDLIQEIEEHVVAKIGSIARLEKIFITAELPKTRSGKIMRRLLRDIANGNVIGDTTTLADPVIVEQLKQRYESEEGN